MKQIENNTIIKINGWKGNFEVAKVTDMGIDKDYAQYVTDEDRLYAGARARFLSSNTSIYDEEDARYANPIVVEDGEIVELKSNGRQYRVKNMAGGSRFAYYSDILHFELVK